MMLAEALAKCVNVSVALALRRRQNRTRMRPADRTIDLNVDVGEGYHSDAELMTLATSVNVGSSAYGGSRKSTRSALYKAAEQGCRIGAHVGYPDPESFGRRSLRIGLDGLHRSLLEQLGNIRQLAREVGLDEPYDYLKPHGALYHDCTHYPDVANVVARVSIQAGVPVLADGRGHLYRWARAKGMGYAEGFAARRYLPTGDLLPRSEPGCVFTHVDSVARQGVRLAMGAGVVTTVGVLDIPVPDSISIQGELPHAVGMARALKYSLEKLRIGLRAFL